MFWKIFLCTNFYQTYNILTNKTYIMLILSYQSLSLSLFELIEPISSLDKKKVRWVAESTGFDDCFINLVKVRIKVCLIFKILYYSSTHYSFIYYESVHLHQLMRCVRWLGFIQGRIDHFNTFQYWYTLFYHYLNILLLLSDNLRVGRPNQLKNIFSTSSLSQLLQTTGS